MPVNASQRALAFRLLAAIVRSDSKLQHKTHRWLKGVNVMKYLMALIIALLVPTAAMAKGECKADKQKFCKNAAHVGACLDQHKAELSEACKANREAKASAKKNTEEPAKMGKEEGAHAQPGAQPLTKEGCKKAGLKWNDQSNVCG